MKTAARGAFELRRSLSRSPLSARCTSLPPSRPARSPARSLALPIPDESSTSWRKAGTQGLSSESSNYQDRDPPTQYSNLYTYLEQPALPLGKHPLGAGRGGRGAGRLERDSFKLAAVRTGPARSRALRTEVVEPVWTTGGLHKGWPLKEGISEATGTEESEPMSSGVPGNKSRVLSSEEPWGLF
ncbi:uncharacterized protein LOC144612954 [Panthera onca]